MRHEPIFAGEATAARLLDLKPAEFRALVEAGHLPPPISIGPVKRYDVDQLRRVIRGDAIQPAGGMEW